MRFVAAKKETRRITGRLYIFAISSRLRYYFYLSSCVFLLFPQRRDVELYLESSIWEFILFVCFINFPRDEILFWDIQLSI